MSYRLSITNKAEHQLEAIANWYCEQSQSREVGEAWFAGFVDALHAVCDNPDLCSLAPENDDVPFELRELHYGSGRKRTHRALFRIQGAVVEVLAIRHFAQRAITRDELT